jgi:hypothetical protein
LAVSVAGFLSRGIESGKLDYFLLGIHLASPAAARGLVFRPGAVGAAAANMPGIAQGYADGKKDGRQDEKSGGHR